MNKMGIKGDNAPTFCIEPSISWAQGRKF
jgi:hypothetical protein